MRVRIYEIEDHDVIDTFFGENQPDRAMADLGAEHGTLISKTLMSILPQEDDLLIVNEREYVVLLRVFHSESDEASLLVHARHFEGGQLS